jgi:hypothetical protein
VSAVGLLREAESTTVNHERASIEDEVPQGNRVWLYAGVVLAEIVVFLSLWMLGRHFGS